MKSRQTVPKKLAIAILAVLFVVISATQLQAQSDQAKYHAKLQKEYSWENYQSTWKKNEMANAKEFRKAKKDKAKEIKDRQKFFARIERMRR